MAKKIGVAILGLGEVGGGTYKTLVEHHDFYLKTQQVDITVEAVMDRNPPKIKALGISEEIVAKNIEEVVANPNVDIVVEALGGIEAAKDYVTAALREGKSVVTSNKELVCKFSHELERIAKRNRCGLYYEASCVGGVPIIRTLLDGLQANNISEMMGIVNGTTNYILTKMTQEGKGYEEALKEAQALGFAEANPMNDVEGFDSIFKLSILSSIAFHTKVPYTKIFREGITKITKTDILFGKKLGYTLKLLAIGKNTEKGIEVRVHPTFISDTHPLASVNDSFNAVFVKGDAVGDVMLYGHGAGSLPTASAVASDVLYAATHSEIKYSTFKNSSTPDSNVKFISDFTSAYYVRIYVEDVTGSLAKISGIFSKCGISICAVSQNGVATNGKIDLAVITYKTSENTMRNALAKINNSGFGSVQTIIHIEDEPKA